MLLLQVNIDFLPNDCEECHNILTQFVFLIPRIGIVKNIVSLGVEPLDLVGIRSVSFEHSISATFILVKVQNEALILDCKGWIELQWKIRNDSVVLSDHKIMKHPW